MATLEQAQKIAALVAEIGIDNTAEQLGISRETVRRENRRAKQAIAGLAPLEPESSVMRKLAERFTPQELALIANGKALNPESMPRPVRSFEGEDVVIGFITDTHIGGKEFDDSLWYAFLEECGREGVQHILHAGDLIEGMSNRPDQIYQLADIGASAQMAHARELLALTDIPISIIDGNHDRWSIKAGGLFVVQEIARDFDHVEFLGSDIGEVEINGTRWMLWHGEDGSSYATSYRPQKIVESFTGGQKPAVLLCGHTHKQGYFFERNIHVISGGALSYQSAWMRATRKPCHTGFHIIHARIRDGEIVRFAPIWYPFYK